MTLLPRGLVHHTRPPIPGFGRTDPLDRGLVGEWRFDRQTGVVLPDYSGRGFHGVVSGATWITTQMGSTLDFDGTNDFVKVIDNALMPLDGLTQATWECYAIITEDAGDFAKRGLFMYTATAATGVQAMGFYWQDSPSRMRFSTVANNAQVISEIGGLSHDVPIHVVGVYDGTNQYLYIDGVERDSDAQNGTLDAALNNMDIGRYVGTYLECQVALARLYIRALTPQEVCKRYEIVRKRNHEPLSIWPIPWGYITAIRIPRYGFTNFQIPGIV